MIIKKLSGGTLLDKTRVDRTYFPSIKMTKELLNNIRKAKLQDIILKNLSEIYDTKKAQFYSNLLNFYNTNFFGYGIFGTPTRYNPTTLHGLLAILLNFNYSKDNMINFMTNLGLGYLGFRFKPIVSSGGNIETYEPFIIGEGAESVVIDNSPITVAKVSYIPIEEMELKNTIPGVERSKYIGTMNIGEKELHVYVLNKVKIIDDNNTFLKYRNKLKDFMFKHRFRRLVNPLGPYDAFYNRSYVIDDISPGNVGLDRFGNLKIIDFNISTPEEWMEEYGPIKGLINY